MSKSKAQSAVSATATNIHSIRAFARCADGDRPTVKSPYKANRVVLQLIRGATEVDGIRVGGQSAAHKAEQRPSDSLTDRCHARWLGGAVPRSHWPAELIGDKIVEEAGDRETRPTSRVSVTASCSRNGPGSSNPIHSNGIGYTNHRWQDGKQV